LGTKSSTNNPNPYPNPKKKICGSESEKNEFGSTTLSLSVLNWKNTIYYYNTSLGLGNTSLGLGETLALEEGILVGLAAQEILEQVHAVP
jgi:hypothetical protein